MIRRKLMLFALPLMLGMAWADQITVKNGDRVTGKIQKKDGASLVVKTDIFGIVTIPWDAVTQISCDDTLTIVLPGGKSVLGKIAAENAKLTITTAAGSESISMAQVATIRNADEQKVFERFEHPGLLALWTGYADLGISLAQGNSNATTVSTAVKATRQTRTDKISLYFNQIYAKGKDGSGKTFTTADAVRGGWAYNRNVNPRMFLNIFNDYESDSFQNLDLRLVVGAGVGYNLIKGDRTQIGLVGGSDYSREKFTALNRNSGEFYWGDNFLHKFSKITTVTQSFRMFDNLSDTGQYRINFDLGQSTQINRWLSWQLTFSNRFLSNPVPGLKKNDMLFTTGVRYSFAR